MKAASIPSGIFERIPRVQRILLLVFIVLVGTLLIGTTMIYTPWRQRRAEIEHRYGEETQRMNAISAIKNQEEQLAEREKSFLLESGETAALTSEVTRLASKTSVSIESVLPQSSLRIGSYTKLQIRVVAAAAFGDLLRFMYALEKHEPLLKIDQFEIGEFSRTQPEDNTYRAGSTAQAERAASNTDRQKVRFLISAYAASEKRGTP